MHVPRRVRDLVATLGVACAALVPRGCEECSSDFDCNVGQVCTFGSCQTERGRRPTPLRTPDASVPET